MHAGRHQARTVARKRMVGPCDLGLEGAVVVQQVLSSKGNSGYNVATGNYEDLVKAGVIDPTKVTRTALQNAASIAGLILTTDCAIAKPKPAPKAS